jgi:Arc/MetJ family transcription regulator
MYAISMTMTKTHVARTAGRTSASAERPPSSNVKRATVNLPAALIRQAQLVLGTRGVTSTLVDALQHVVNWQLRMGLLEHDFSSLSGEALHSMRKGGMPANADSRSLRTLFEANPVASRTRPGRLARESHPGRTSHAISPTSRKARA